MAIAINGSTNVITGVAVGGLPDAIVDADMLAANAVTAGKLASGVGGKNLNVVHTTDNTAYSQSSNTYTDMGLSATITPQTNSKVLILIQIHCLMEGSNNEGYGIKILRDSTDIYTSPNTAGYELYHYNSSTSEQRFRSGWNHLDSSVGGNGSTAITYKVQVATFGSRSVTFTENGCNSTMTLYEIGA